ncbi:sensor histidine kinase [Nonomuraea sp. NPDC049309]|uniref:sensor histidine kinase n=1 Tax=Nonomuraea sp. NPDC049309 TaxID=3364350 RepID=UPI003710045F
MKDPRGANGTGALVRRAVRRGSLRSRLTVLITAVVATAIAVCAGLSWLIVQDQLIRQIDQSILEPEGPGDRRYLQERCSPQGSTEYHEMATLLFADGRTCSLGSPVATTGDDARALIERGEPMHRNGVTRKGVPIHVVTMNFAPGVAVLEARPLSHVRIMLRNAAILLGAVAVVGAFGAGVAGLWVSRIALRPVGRLTEAVERIARTEDLHIRIPVQGRDEIARLSASFNAMTAALAGSRERQQQLIADAGHELRTPLTTLRTNIDLLLRSERTGRQLDPDARQRLLTNVKDQFAELSTLVGDLLQLARGDTDREPPTQVAFHDVVAAAAQRARLRGAQVVTDLTAWYVIGSPASLERAVLNLIDNAAKFSHGGQVEVTLRDGRLSVRDHGPGIPEQELPHVFERFWRSPTARGLPGSGLGLAIVTQAVSESGGRIRLANAPDGGVIATVDLPGSATHS